jgi:hypothetical protein
MQVTILSYDSTECGLCFKQQVLLPEETEVVALEQLQLEEDARLFGTRFETSLRNSDEVDLEGILPQRLTAEVRESTALASPERSGTSLSPNIDLLTAANNISEREASSSRTAAPSQAPIYAWLANTEPPEDPDSVIKWREASETHRGLRQNQDASDLEVFKNVELSLPLNDDVPKPFKVDEGRSSHAETEAGAYLLLRNILDRYPSLDEPVAWRFAQGNWERMKVLQETERTAPIPATDPSRPQFGPTNDHPGESGSSNDGSETKPTLEHLFRDSSRRLLQPNLRKRCSLPPPPPLVRARLPDSGYNASCHICHQTIRLRHKRDWR